MSAGESTHHGASLLYCIRYSKVTPKESEVSTVTASSARGVKSTRSKYIIFILINNYYIALGTAKVTPKE